MFYYLIALSDYKYYVMLSENLNLMISDISVIKICDWLLCYRPLYIKEIIKYNAKYTVDDHVIYFMQQYGQNNVRGGTFINVILSISEKNLLNKMQDTRHFKLRHTIDNRWYNCCFRRSNKYKSLLSLVEIIK